MKSEISSYLNLIRFSAAMAVFLFHGQHFAHVQVPYIGNLGNEAVLAFFVLSGMLITFSGIRQAHGGAFLRARLVRLWSIALPALALTMLADMLGQYISLPSYAPMQPYDCFKWAASIGINALFLNQTWYANVYAGTNGPFWSLSYEFWFYMIFAAAVYFRGKKRILAVLCAALVAGPKILVGLPIWLMGSAVYFAVKSAGPTNRAKGLLLWAGSLIAGVAFAAFDISSILRAEFPEIAKDAKWAVNFWPASYVLGALVAINIYGFSLIASSFKILFAVLAQPIRLGADISFGLYLFHYPLFYLAKAILNSFGVFDGSAFVVSMYAVPFAVAAYLALQCEQRKDVFAKLFDRTLIAARGWLSARHAEISSLEAEDPLLPSHRTKSYSPGEDKLLF